MSRPVAPTLALVLAVVVAGCGKSNDSTSSTAAKAAGGATDTSTTSTDAASGGACTPAKPKNKGPQHLA
jgi:hypothetical protein